MVNPFIQRNENNVAYIDSNCSINKLIIAKTPLHGFEYLEGLSAKEIFGSEVLINYIKELASAKGMDISSFYDSELPGYVNDQFIDDNSQFHDEACKIIREFGYRFGIILLTLKTGLKENRLVRKDWDDSNWEYYAKLKTIILVGGLANGQLGEQLRLRALEIFEKANVVPYDIKIFENASYFGVLGAASQITKDNSDNIVFDFGHTNIKRAVVSIREGKVSDMVKLDNRPSWFVMDGIHDNDILLDEAKKLHNNLLTVIADTYSQVANDFELNNEIVISIASYTVAGMLNKKRGGYAKLTLLGDNYKELLENDLRERIHKDIRITLVHDGTAVAMYFKDYKDAVCMSIGTAFGIGFPDMN